MRIVRHGGWSWGLDQDSLSRLATQSLLTAVAQGIAEKVATADEEDIQIRDPIVLKFRIQAAHWRSILNSSGDSVTLLQHLISDQLGPVIKNLELESLSSANTAARHQSAERDLKSLDSHLKPDAGQPSFELQADLHAPDSGASRLVSAHSEGQPLRAVTLAQIVLQWYETGKLSFLLRQFTLEALAVWERKLLGDHTASAASAATTNQQDISPSSNRSQVATSPFTAVGPTEIHSAKSELERRLATLASTVPSTADERTIRGFRIFALALSMATEGNPLPREMLDRYLPIRLSSDSSSAQQTQADPEIASKSSPDRLADARKGSQVASQTEALRPGVSSSPSFETPRRRMATSPRNAKPVSSREVKISSVLPFLLLHPLSQAGYLEALEATFAAAGMEDYLETFAEALALKVLDKPQRGWRFDSETRRSAAAFAGIEDTSSGRHIGRLSDESESLASPLNALLGAGLLANADDPLFITTVRSNGREQWLLVDPQGYFPCCLAGDPAALCSALGQRESVSLVISHAAAQEELFSQLDEAGHQFITDAAPTRTETWASLEGRSGKRLWTNRLIGVPPTKKCREILEDGELAATQFWHEIAISRPAMPTASSHRLDDLLSVTAGASLAQVAWQLWKDRETTYPTLALERLRDLSAVIRYLPDKVDVKIPLGRRSMDLFASGLIGELSYVPWFPGRHIQFSQG